MDVGERTRESWHLEKGVSISHILGTVALAMGAIMAFYNMSERVAIVEEKVIQLLETQQRIDQRQDETLLLFREEMRVDTRNIEAKIDRILERL